MHYARLSQSRLSERSMLCTGSASHRPHFHLNKFLAEILCSPKQVCKKEAIASLNKSIIELLCSPPPVLTDREVNAIHSECIIGPASVLT